MNFRRKIPVYSVYGGRTHSPLALGMIVAFAKSYKHGALNDTYEFVPDAITSLESVRGIVWKRGAGIFLCSDYQWSTARNLAISKVVKAFFPDSLIVHGGPDVPKYEDDCRDFFKRHAGVDVAVRGEGELTTAELLERFASHATGSAPADRRYLSDVRGITFRTGTGGIVRTDDRPNAKDLDGFPSPYLTGWFRDDDASHWRAAVIETNRGCPYGCTFCDWGSATLSKIRQFAIERVEAEIEWVARNRIGLLWIADANFGIFPRDVRIAETLAACRRKYGYPNEMIVNYAKNATERMAKIVGIVHASGIKVSGVISIQTRDPETLSIVDRSNIKTERYDELIDVFRQYSLPISSDLMVGLPGSTPATFKADLQFFFDRKVNVKMYPTILLPNSPMAQRDYIERHKIKVDAKNKVVSTYSYSAADLRRMDFLRRIYQLAVWCSSLKYLLYYLQVDHRIMAVDFLEALQSELEHRGGSLPHMRRVIEGNLPGLAGMVPDDWNSLYDEIGGFIAARYGIADRATKMVLRVQRTIMPAKGRRLPESLQIEHDFTAYFDQIKRAKNIEGWGGSELRPLAEFGPAILVVSDPQGLCDVELTKPYDLHLFNWELSSALTD